jgi:hypothetical protein
VKRACGVVAAVLLLAACDSAAPRKPHSTSASLGSSSISAPPPPSSARLPSPLPTSTTPSPTPSDALSAKAFAALITAGDLPHGFTELPYGETSIPQPCAAAGAKPVLTQLPPATRAARQFALASPHAVLAEDVLVMPSAAQAGRLVTVTTAGLACGTGSFQPAGGPTQAVIVKGPQSISSVVAVPGWSPVSWTLQNESLSVSFVVARDERVVVTLAFVVSTTSDLTELPQDLGPTIARQALIKVRTAGLVP